MVAWNFAAQTLPLNPAFQIAQSKSPFQIPSQGSEGRNDGNHSREVDRVNPMISLGLRLPPHRCLASASSQEQ